MEYRYAATAAVGTNAINEEYFDEALKLNVRKNARQYTYRRSPSYTPE